MGQRNGRAQCKTKKEKETTWQELEEKFQGRAVTIKVADKRQTREIGDTRNRERYKNAQHHSSICRQTDRHTQSHKKRKSRNISLWLFCINIDSKHNL